MWRGWYALCKGRKYCSFSRGGQSQNNDCSIEDISQFLTNSWQTPPTSKTACSSSSRDVGPLHICREGSPFPCLHKPCTMCWVLIQTPSSPSSAAPHCWSIKLFKHPNQMERTHFCFCDWKSILSGQAFTIKKVQIQCKNKDRLNICKTKQVEECKSLLAAGSKLCRSTVIKWLLLAIQADNAEVNEAVITAEMQRLIWQKALQRTFEDHHSGRQHLTPRHC